MFARYSQRREWQSHLVTGGPFRVTRSLLTEHPIGDVRESFKQSGSRIAYRIRQEYGQMPLINIVIALIIVGVALWLINRFIPMASSIKTILNVVVVVAVCVWVLQATGIWGPLSSYRLSR